MSGAITKDKSLDDLKMLARTILVVNASPENCKDQKVNYNSKDIQIHFCEYTVKEVIKGSDSGLKANSKVRVVSSDYLSPLEEIPEGKWVIQKTNKNIIAPSDAQGDHLVLLSSKDEKIDAYVGVIDFGILKLELRSRF